MYICFGLDLQHACRYLLLVWLIYLVLNLRYTLFASLDCIYVLLVWICNMHLGIFFWFDWCIWFWICPIFFLLPPWIGHLNGCFFSGFLPAPSDFFFKISGLCSVFWFGFHTLPFGYIMQFYTEPLPASMKRGFSVSVFLGTREHVWNAPKMNGTFEERRVFFGNVLIIF